MTIPLQLVCDEPATEPIGARVFVEFPGGNRMELKGPVHLDVDANGGVHILPEAGTAPPVTTTPEVDDPKDEYGGDTPFSVVIEAFEQHLLLRGTSSHWRNTTLGLLRRMATEFQWEVVSDVSRKDAEQWMLLLMEAGRAAATRNDNLKKLRLFGRFLVDMGYVAPTDRYMESDCGPFNGMRRARGPAGEGSRPLTTAEFGRLIAELNRDPTYARLARVRFYRFAFATGLRRGELGRLKVADIEDGCVVIRAESTKSRKTERVPLSKAALEVVAVETSGRDADKPFFLRPVKQETLLKDCRAAGISTKRVGFHSFRKGFATALSASGVGPAMVSKLLRHASLDMSYQRYIEPDDVAKLDALEQLAEVGVAEDGAEAISSGVS